MEREAGSQMEKRRVKRRCARQGKGKAFRLSLRRCRARVAALFEKMGREPGIRFGKVSFSRDSECGRGREKRAEIGCGRVLYIADRAMAVGIGKTTRMQPGVRLRIGREPAECDEQDQKEETPCAANRLEISFPGVARRNATVGIVRVGVVRAGGSGFHQQLPGGRNAFRRSGQQRNRGLAVNQHAHPRVGTETGKIAGNAPNSFLVRGELSRDMDGDLGASSLHARFCPVLRADSLCADLNDLRQRLDRSLAWGGDFELDFGVVRHVP